MAARFSLAIAILAVLAGDVRAEPRVLLVEFEGARVRPFYKLVKDLLEERGIEVVIDAAANASVGTATKPVELSELARRLEVNAVITGAIAAKSRRRKVLEVQLAIDGTQTTETIALGRRPRLTRSLRKTIRTRVFALVEALGAAMERQKKPANAAEKLAERENKLAECKPLMDSGFEKAQAKEYALARTDLEQAYQTCKDPVALIIIARTYQEQERFGDALDYAERFIEEAGPDHALTPKIKAAVVELRRRADEAKAEQDRLAKQAADEAAKAAKPKWENFALMRPPIPGRHRVYLRSYYDSRSYGALEGLIRVRTPIDFVVVGRTTVRYFPDETQLDMPDSKNPNTFGFFAVYSPAVLGFGAVAHIGSPLGPGQDAFRSGLTHTIGFKIAGRFNLFFLSMFLPYDSTRTGGLGISSVTAVGGPIRANVVTAWTWRVITEIQDSTTPSYVRPDISLRLWNKFSVYAQYEYNASLTPDFQKGIRVGLEVKTGF